MIQRVLTTILIAFVYIVLSVQYLPRAHSTEAHGKVSSASLQRMMLSTRTSPETTAVVPDNFETASLPISTVAHYDTQDQSWTFTARVVELKDVLICGIPGRFVRIEYIREGKTQHAWAVLSIDGYHFTKGSFAPAVGQGIRLEVSGIFVTPYGVNFDKCSSDEEYCEYARSIEGGFPTSEVYNGMPLYPSNILIYSGLMPADWINGMLAWKITLSN